MLYFEETGNSRTNGFSTNVVTGACPLFNPYSQGPMAVDSYYNLYSFDVSYNPCKLVTLFISCFFWLNDKYK